MGTRLYIGNLSSGARERDIERFFKGYGKIREVVLKNGYGFVELDDYRDADDAIYELNGRNLKGDRVTVEHAHGTPHGRDMLRDQERGFRYGGGGGGGGGRRRSGGDRGRRDRFGPPVRTEHRLIVENLSSRTSWQDLKDVMRKAGEITYADAHRLHKNEGVVEFASYDDMRRALDKLDGTEVNGRKIRLIEDKPRSRKRSRSSSHSRSRSRSRSRRRSRSQSSRSKSGSRSPRSMTKSKSRSPSPATNKKYDDDDDKSDREDD